MKFLARFLSVFALLTVFSLVAFGQDPAPADNITVMGIDLSVILSIVFGAFSAVAGGLWGIAKSKLGQALTLLQAVVQAVEDNTITNEELNDIVQKAKALIGKV